VRSDVAAYLDSTEVHATAGGVSLSAIDNASLHARDASEVTAKGGLSGVIVTNLVLSGSHAFIVDSTVTQAVTDAVSLLANTTSEIKAVSTTKVNGKDAANIALGFGNVGFILAFNTVGWQ